MARVFEVGMEDPSSGSQALSAGSPHKAFAVAFEHQVFIKDDDKDNVHDKCSVDATCSFKTGWRRTLCYRRPLPLIDYSSVF